MGANKLSGSCALFRWFTTSRLLLVSILLFSVAGFVWNTMYTINSLSLKDDVPAGDDVPVQSEIRETQEIRKTTHTPVSLEKDLEMTLPKFDFLGTRRRQREIGRARPGYLEGLSRVFKGTCQEVTSKGIQKVCCSLENDEKYCLPGIVVIGSQKGGTTALHSYMMLSKSLYASNKKELHLWDSDKQFQKWGSTMKSNFNSKPTMERVGFESTPSYLASTMACQRMSTWLPPSTKYVIILRDPVQRFWSEYQMKARRIRTQDNTMLALMEEKDKLYRCMRIGKKDSGFKESSEECLERLFSTSRGKIPGTPSKLAQIRKRLHRITRNPERVAMFAEECLSENDVDSVEIRRECFHRHGVLLEKLPDLHSIVRSERYDLRVCSSEWFKPYTASYTISGASFDQNKCDKMLKEKWCPKCFQNSNDEPMKQCLSSCIHVDSPFLSQAIKLGCDLKGINNQYPFRRLGDAMACEGGTCKCYPQVRNFADISKNFLWRGLYYPQLVTCMRHIPMEQILIIENEELRLNPNQTINKILSASGLPAEDYSHFTWDDAETAFSLRYPSFEAATGWSADGSSSNKMPESLKIFLHEFYRESNERLFELIGRRFDHWLPKGKAKL